MKNLIMIAILGLSFANQLAVGQPGGEKLSLMGPEIRKGQWAWTVIGLKQGEKISPVEYEWRSGDVTIETVCRNANANYGYDECLVAAKILFAERCIDLKEEAYCRAFRKLRLL